MCLSCTAKKCSPVVEQIKQIFPDPVAYYLSSYVVVSLKSRELYLNHVMATLIVGVLVVVYL